MGLIAPELESVSFILHPSPTLSPTSCFPVWNPWTLARAGPQQSGDRMGEQCLRLGVSDDLMTVAWLVPGNFSVQRYRIFSCCGKTLHEEALCNSPFSSNLDLSQKSSVNKRNFMLDNYNVSPVSLFLLLPQCVGMDKCILMIKYQGIFCSDRYYQIHTNGLILMNTSRRVHIEKYTFSG